jgi:acyl-CoA hydrolase
MQGEQKAKSPGESAVDMTEMMLPNDANPQGNVLGARVLYLIDLAGGMAAHRHCNGQVVTASMDGMKFLHKVEVGQILILRALVNRAFNTSMEVGVDVFSEDIRTGERQRTGTAFLTYVAMDDSGRPAKVPAIVPQTPEEQNKYNEAGLRRSARLGEERKDR